MTKIVFAEVERINPERSVFDSMSKLKAGREERVRLLRAGALTLYALMVPVRRSANAWLRRLEQRHLVASPRFFKAGTSKLELVQSYVPDRNLGFP